MCLSQYNLLEFQNEGNDFLIVLALMYDNSGVTGANSNCDKLQLYWYCILTATTNGSENRDKTIGK